MAPVVVSELELEYKEAGRMLLKTIRNMMSNFDNYFYCNFIPVVLRKRRKFVISECQCHCRYECSGISMKKVLLKLRRSCVSFRFTDYYNLNFVDDRKQR